MRRWLAWIMACASFATGVGSIAHAHDDEVHPLKLVNGSWFDGQGFVARDVFSVGGVLRNHYSGAVDDTVDLHGGYVVPPYADAHTHLFGDTSTFRQDLARFLRAGILFAKNPNNPASRVALMRDLVGRPRVIEAVYANGGLTSSGGHPSQIYEGGGSGERARWADDAYVFIDDRAALDRKWPAILAGRPDFIKVYLEHSEDHARRRDRPEFAGRYGLDPQLLPKIVERAHRSGLEVSCHVATAADFRAAVAAGVDEINHLPLERLTADDAREAAKRHVTVVTTVVSHRSTEGIFDLDDIHGANLRLLAAEGVTIALGTDHSGLTVLDEADRIRALGAFSELELLRLLVVATPRAVMPARRLGSLSDGAEATFLVLEGDPLADPGNLRRVRLRMKRGLPIEPPAGKTSVAEPMMPALMRGGVDSALAVYDRLKREHPDTYDFGEQALNRLGYALIQHRQVSPAIAIFQRNASLFPDSPNVYDSLADGYVAAGDSIRAAAAYGNVLNALARNHDGAPEYRRSLESRAREQIAKLRGASVKMR